MIPDPKLLRFTHQITPPEESSCPALLVGVFEGESKPRGLLARMVTVCDVPVQALLDCREISGSFGEFTLIHVPPGKTFQRIIVMGMGNRTEFDADKIRSITARAVRTLRKVGCPRVAFLPSDFPSNIEDTVEAVTVGTLLGLYKFVHFLEDESVAYRRPFLEVACLVEDQKTLERARMASSRAQVLGWATIFARNLGNEPANHCTPATLAKTAQSMASTHSKMSITVHERDELVRMGMGGILAVGSGSAIPPCLIELWWKGREDPNTPVVCIIGKGITFDGGGLCIKQGHGMHTMKFDMCGAAAVMGVMRAVAELDLPIRLLCLIPTAENLIDANSFRPSDIITLYDGTNVEIIDTDAEGRLLLADALAYAVSKDVDCIVDIATLTGGVIRALGHCGSGVMGTNQQLVDWLISAGRRSAERMWQLPLWPDYRIHLKSSVAAIANCNQSSGVAAASTAATFLQTFVKTVPWAHIDIAGTASIDEDTTVYVHKPYLPKRGATGVGVRTLVRLLETIVKQAGGDRVGFSKTLQRGRRDHD